MNWKEKIKRGMELIKEGCAEQETYSKCCQCPFNEYCGVLEDSDIYEPDNWEIEEY